MANAKWKTTVAVAAATITLASSGVAHALELVSPDIAGKDPKFGATDPITKTVGVDPKMTAPQLEAQEVELDPSRVHLRFAYDGPGEDLCMQPSGTVVRRRACSRGEVSTDPSALRLCATPRGAVSIKAARCGENEQEVDLRRVHRSTPGSFFVQIAAPAAAVEVMAPTLIEFDIDPSDAPVMRPELCRTSRAGVTLRSACPKGESPLHPTGVVACARKSGGVVVRGLACPKAESAIDLRALRGAGSEVVGFGPIVGLFPSLSDLATDYPRGPGA